MIRYIISCFLIVACGACVTTGKKASPYDPQRDVSPVEIPARYLPQPLNPENLPVDVDLAMAAITQTIRGETPDIPKFKILPGAMEKVVDNSLANLDLIAVTILDRVEREAVKGRQWETKTMAVLTFGLGPFQAQMLAEAMCTVTQTEVVLTKAKTRRMSPAQPRAVAWFVPKKSFQAASSTLSTRNPWDLMALTGPLGVGTGKGLPPATGEYMVVVFVVDRLESSDDVRGGVCAGPMPSDGFSDKATVYSANGWPILTADIDVPLNTPEKERFMHVIWRPNDETRTGGEKVDIPIGRFSTCGTTFAANRFVEQSSLSSGAAMIETGQRFLDPKNADDAKLIQARLADLGFYSAAIDGAFGKGSRAALAQFKQTNGLGGNGNWDLPTQQALFSGTGQ